MDGYLDSFMTIYFIMGYAGFSFILQSKPPISLLTPPLNHQNPQLTSGFHINDPHGSDTDAINICVTFEFLAVVA